MAVTIDALGPRLHHCWIGLMGTFINSMSLWLTYDCAARSGDGGHAALEWHNAGHSSITS